MLRLILDSLPLREAAGLFLNFREFAQGVTVVDGHDFNEVIQLLIPIREDGFAQRTAGIADVV